MTNYEKNEIESSMMWMFESFLKMDPSKVFFSKSSIRQALEEYGYETISEYYNSSIENSSEENENTVELFNFCNRVAELAYHESLEYLDDMGLGDYGVGKDGDIIFMLNEKGKNFSEQL